MVVGGVPHTDRVEVVSLDPQTHPVPACVSDMLDPFPIAISDMAGGLIWPGGI